MGPTFILVGQGFLNTSQLACRVGNGESSSATFISPTEISCTDPGPFANKISTVVEVTLNGVDYSADGAMFTHLRKPYVLSIDPTSGTTYGGTSVFLSGEHFLESERLACRFGELVVPAQWMSEELLQCNSPPIPDNNVVFVEITTDGHDFTSSGITFSFHRTKVLGFFPSLGSTSGGTLVSIFGEGFYFSSDFVVRFGQRNVQVKFKSSSVLQCFTPEYFQTGEVQIAVASDGISFDGSPNGVFTYISPISLAFVEPTWSFEGDGTIVILYGGNFTTHTELVCSFGSDGLSLGAKFISASQTSCEIPTSVANGKYSLEISTNGQDFTNSGISFFVYEKPSLLSFTPASNLDRRGEAVHMKGVNLQRGLGLECLFGSTSVSARWESSTSLWCTSPWNIKGDTVELMLTLDGRLYSTTSHVFTFLHPSSAQCLASGSSERYVAGSQLNQPLANTSLKNQLEYLVRIASVDYELTSTECSSFDMESECKVRSDLAFPTTTTEDPRKGVADNTYGGNLTPTATPSTTMLITPDHGSVDGDTVILAAGTNFIDTANIDCNFGTSHFCGRWLSTSSVACVSPPQDIGMRVPFGITINGVASSSVPLFFNYESYPSVTALLPYFGSVQGGTLISIHGNDFFFSNSLRARFGNTSVSVFFVSPQELRCISPSSFPGEKTVVIGDRDKKFPSGTDLIFTYTDTPTVDFLYPQHGSTMGGLKLNVHGQGFANSSNLACLFGKAELVTATFVSSTEIECKTPAFVEPGPEELEVTVTGNDFTSTGNLFMFTRGPVVFSVFPDCGSASGGTPVLVEGINFVDSDELACHFGDISVPGRCISSTTIQCLTPTSVGNTTISLGIYFAEGQVTLGDLDFYFFSQPIIQEVFPSRGTIQGGNTVSIVGLGFWFSGELRVRFGRTDVPATFVSAFELQCIVPASSSGVSTMSISFNGIDFLGGDDVVYNYVVPTRVFTLFPSQGPQAGGTHVIVRGRGFRNNSGLVCMFGGKHTPATYHSETHIACVTPQATDGRTVAVTVTVDRIESAAESKDFVYIGGAYVSSIHPNSGPLSGGTLVRINGSNFVNIDKLSCMFGSRKVSAQWISSSQVWCTSPKLSKANDVKLTLEGGKAERLQSDEIFSYFPQPVLLSISPDTGSIDGGTAVSLVGVDFTFSNTLRASFGPTEVPVIFVNSTLLLCFTAASSAQIVEVGLSANGADFADHQRPSFTFRRKPRVVALEPSRGAIPGGTSISVRGNGFHRTATLACRFGPGDGTVVRGEFVSVEEIVCATPKMTDCGSYPVEVTTNGVDYSGNGRRFTLHKKIFITSVNPTYFYSNVVSGTPVLVQGGHFIDSEALGCNFGPSVATAGRWISPTLVQCELPSADSINIRQRGNISLTTTFNHQHKTEGIYFQLEQPISVTSLYPKAGSTLGGTTVFVSGNGFLFAGDLRMRFGGIEVSATFVSEQLLRCVTPGGEAGLVDVMLMIGSYVFETSLISFQYVQTITEASAVVQFASNFGTARAIVRGMGFANTTHLSCRFDGKIVIPATYTSMSEMSCNIPLFLAPKLALLEVSVDGIDFAVANTKFDFSDYESFLKVDPPSGPRWGGTLIIVSGKTKTRRERVECMFGLKTVPALWLSEETIQCQSPAWEENVSQVYVTIIINGLGAGRGSFTYIQSSILSVFPEEGELSGGTLVTLSGSGFDAERQWFCWFGLEKTPAVVVIERGSSLQCLSPPSDSDVFVNLRAAVGSSFPGITSGVPFRYISLVEVVSLKPASGSVFGGTSVEVTVQHAFEKYYPPLYCDFGDLGFSDSLWLREESVLCVAPPSPYQRKVSVSVYSSGTGRKQTNNSILFWYFFPPTVSFIHPLEVEEANNDATAVVTVTGGNFVGTEYLSCRIGKVIVKALWISASVLQCPFFGIAPGEHGFEISNNMVDFVSAGVRLVIIPRGLLVMGGRQVIPSRGSTEDRTSVEVFGPDVALLSSTQHCVLGDLAVNSTTLHEGQVGCVAVAHDEGEMPVGLCDVNTSCSMVQDLFSLEHIPIVTRLSPDMSPTRGGIMVKVDTSKGCHVKGKTWCQVDDITLLATSVGLDSVTCLMPAHTDGLAEVSVSCNRIGFSKTLPFRYYPEIMVHDVSPLSVSKDGRPVIHVSGRGFQNFANGSFVENRLLCVFDEASTPALWVSEALALCRPPTRAPGVGVLRVLTSLHPEPLAYKNITYIANGHRENGFILSPNAGTMNGGTVVSIVGEQQLKDPVLCVFGDQIVSPTSVHPSEIACSTPEAMIPGVVEVALISSDYKEIVGEFEYKINLQLEGLSPATLDIDGGSKVIVFIGKVLGFIPDIVNLSCRIGNVTVPARLHSDGRRVEFIAPTHSQGPATVVLWEGGYQISRGDFTLLYLPMPVVSKIRPRRGFSSEEAVVNVHGHNFVYSENLVCFFGNARATHVEFLSSTRLQCISPKLPPGSTLVAVSLDGRTFSTTSNASTYEVHQDPLVRGLDPAISSVEGGTVVTIRGENFPSTGGLDCLFEATVTPATVLSQSSLECVIPSLGMGLGIFGLQYAGRMGPPTSRDQQAEFVVKPLEPIAYSIFPAFGSIEGGTNLVVKGNDFSNATQVLCRLRGKSRVVELLADWLSPSTVTCTTPPWHQPEHNVTVELVVNGNIAGALINSSTVFDFVLTPIIEAIFPVFGPESGGTEIQLHGVNFRESKILVCLICEMGTDLCPAVSGKWVSPRELRCTTPEHKPGLTTVNVNYNSLHDTSNSAQFLFVPTPHITKVSPIQGTQKGGTRVLVSGTNLAFTDTIVCRFGEVRTRAAFSGSGIACISPRVFSAAQVSVEVSINGIDFTSDGHSFEYVRLGAEHWSIGVQPKYGDRRGGTLLTVQVMASEFETSLDREYECVFENMSTPPLLPISSPNVICPSPAFLGEGVVNFLLRSTDGATETASTTFGVLPSIELISLEPTSGKSSGGYSVVIIGSGFVDTSLVCCRFGERVTPAEALSATTVRCMTPAWVGRSSNLVWVEVSHNCEDFYGAGLEFRYQHDFFHSFNSSGGLPCDVANDCAPHTLRCMPDYTRPSLSGPTINEPLVCLPLGSVLLSHQAQMLEGSTNGIDLIRLTAAQLSLWSGPVEGGSTVVASGVESDEDGIFCRFASDGRVVLSSAVPSSQAGSIICLTPSWPATGTVLLQVTNADMEVLAVGLPFVFYSQPVLYNIEPSWGYELRQTMIHISASGMQVSTNSTCGFFDLANTLLAASTAIWIENNDIRCLSPALPPGTVVIEVSANAVDFTQGSELMFMIKSEPSLFGIDPVKGASHGGTEITVHGFHFGFSSVVVCRFDEIQVPATVLNENYAVCTTPPISRDLRGAFHVVDFTFVLNGEDVRSSGATVHEFTYFAYPMASSTFPHGGPASGGTSISVTGDNFFDTVGIKCRFEEAVMKATAIDVDRLVCDSPPRSEGVVLDTVKPDGDGTDSPATEPTFTYNFLPWIPLLSATVPLIDRSFMRTGLEGKMLTADLKKYNISKELRPADFMPCPVNDPTLETESNEGECRVTNIRIKDITPNNGPRVGGTTVIVTGFTFVASEVLICHFGAWQARGHVVDSTHLVCSSPPSKVEQVVSFFVSSGVEPLSSEKTDFYYIDTPTITQVQPLVVYEGHGTTQVTIEGKGFQNSSSLACMLSGGSVVLGTYHSATSVLCGVARNTPGYVRLEVTNNGVDFSSNGHGVYLAPPPVITGIDRWTPTLLGASTVIVFGLNFVDVPGFSCIVGEYIVPAKWMSAEKARCSLPAQSLSGVLGVAMTLNQHDLGQGTVEFEHVATSGSQEEATYSAHKASDGGTVIMIDGSTLRSNGNIVCRFSNAGNAIAKVVNNSTVRCVLSTDQAVKTRIQGSTHVDDFSNISAIFSHLVRPLLKSAHPSTGVVDGGTHVTVLGSGFVNTTEIRCHFGAQPALSAIFVSAEKIVCESPPGLTPTSVLLTISLNGMTSSTSVSYRYTARATLLDVFPHEVVFSQESWLTVTGSNFLHGPGLVCLFNKSVSARAQWLSASLLRCPIPITLMPSCNPVAVSVTNNREDVSMFAATIYIHPRSTIHSVFPVRGPTGQATLVTVILRSLHQRLKNEVAERQVFCFFDQEPMQAVFTLIPIHQCEIHGGELPMTCIMVRCTSPPQQEPHNATLRILDGSGATLSDLVTFEFYKRPITYSSVVLFGSYGGGTAVSFKFGTKLMSALPKTVGCLFSDAYDTMFVGGIFFKRSDQSLSVVCNSPPWRSHSGHQSAANVALVVDGRHIDSENRVLMYSNRAKIFALAPAWGTDKGGSEIRIRGTGFPANVLFFCFFADELHLSVIAQVGNSISTPAVRLSDEEVLCELPALLPGLAFIKLAADGEQVDGVLQLIIRSSPQINSLSPFEGPTSGGTVVNVNGNSYFLTGHNACRFGSLTVPAIYVNSHTLLCVSPPASIGVYPMSISMDGEHFEESGFSFQYLEDMVILSMSPLYGWTTGGTVVTLRVSRLQSYEQSVPLLCVFGSSRDPAISVDTQAGNIVCIAPAQQQASVEKSVNGILVTPVSVVAGSGSVPAISSQVFHYFAPVAVMTAVPTRGQIDTKVQVLGENYDTSFELTCEFGTHTTPATFVNSQRVDCYAPANETGQVSVTVWSGGVLPAWHTQAKFTYERPVVLLSIDPSSGRHGDNTAVTVTGSGFQPSADLMCRFGELETPANLVNSTHIRCVAPSQNRGNVNVSISVQRECLSGNFVPFLYQTKTFIHEPVPLEGSLYGGTLLTISGNANLTIADLRCSFSSGKGGSTSSVVIAIHGDTIQCKTPPSPGLTIGTFSMSLVQGESIIAEGADFRFVNPPVMRSIYPETSHKRDGERLLILGENFVSSNELACKFTDTLTGASTTASAQFISSKKMSCTTPAWQTNMYASTHIAIDITTNGVDYTSGGPKFMVHPMAKISMVSPNVGPATGGTAITIIGVSLPRENLACRFGTYFVPAWTISYTQLVCISPKIVQEHQGSIPLDLTVGGYEVTEQGPSFTYLPIFSGEDMTLKSNVDEGGFDTLKLAPAESERNSSKLLIPSISRIEPYSSSSSGSANIVVHGSNFVSSSALTCYFGGIKVIADFLSDVAVQCAAPRHMPAVVFLEVSNDGTLYSVSGLTFRFHADPSILNIEPSHGLVEGFTVVVITGGKFRNSSDLACRFGNIAVPGLYISSNQIECRTPPMERRDATVQVKVHFF